MAEKHLLLKRNTFDQSLLVDGLKAKINALTSLADGEMIVGRYCDITANPATENTLIAVRQINNTSKPFEFFDTHTIEKALSEEIATREKIEGQNASTYTPSTGEYISAATDMTNADKLLSDSIKGLQIIKVTPDAASQPNILTAYTLADLNGNKLGTVEIDIPKDRTLSKVEMGNMDDTVNTTTGTITKTGTGSACLEFVHQLADGTYSLTKIDVSNFFKAAQFGDGLKVSTDGVVSVAKTSDTYGDESNKYLTISADNVDLNGIVTEFNAMSAHTINNYAIGNNPVLNGADVKLDGYVQSTAVEKEVLTVVPTDTVNSAFGKLSKRVLDNETDGATALDDLSKRIAAIKTIEGQTGETYVSEKMGTYISGATSMANADLLLSEGVQNNADDIIAIEKDVIANKITAADESIVVTTSTTGTQLAVGTIDLGTY